MVALVRRSIPPPLPGSHTPCHSARDVGSSGLTTHTPHPGGVSQPASFCGQLSVSNATTCGCVKRLKGTPAAPLAQSDSVHPRYSPRLGTLKAHPRKSDSAHPRHTHGIPRPSITNPRRSYRRFHTGRRFGLFLGPSMSGQMTVLSAKGTQFRQGSSHSESTTVVKS